MASEARDNAPFHELVAALQSVRVAGVDDPNPKYEPALLHALRVPEDMPLPRVQQRVRRVLQISANQLAAPGKAGSATPLPDRRRAQLRSAFLIAAGFSDGSPMSPGDRIEAAMRALGLSRRTTYRRVDEAIELIAHSLLQLPIAPMLEAADYVMSSSTCQVDLSHEQPTVDLSRTLLALTEGIDHLDEQLALPRFTGQKVNFVGLEGCETENATLLWPKMWSIRLRLPYPLRIGDTHRFKIRLTLPDHDSLEPFIGFMPRTSSFEAAVQLTFGETRPRVFLIEDAPPTHSLAQVPGTEVHYDANPLALSFSRLRAGLSYGVRWDFGSGESRTP